MNKIVFFLIICFMDTTMAHMTLEQLEQKRNEARKYIEIGALYYHYRDNTKLYKIIDLGIQEATEDVCVIYQSQYGENLVWVRNLDSWQELVEVNGKKIARFQKK